MKTLITAVALLSIVGGTAVAQTTDPLVGTWKLNAAKSKGSAFKSGTTKVEAAGAGVKFTVELVGPDGATNWAFTANYDGKDNPVTGKSPYGDTVALTTRRRQNNANHRQAGREGHGHSDHRRL